MLLPDMTVLLYTAVVYKYHSLVTLLLFFYQHPPGLQYQNKSLPIPCVRLRKSSSSNLCCVLLRFSSRGLKTTSFLSMCQHYRALKTHEPLDSSLSRHKYHPLRPSRDFILPSPTRTYALPKGRTISHMSVYPKDIATSFMVSGCLSLSGFKTTLHIHHVRHDLSTLPTTPLDFAAV